MKRGRTALTRRQHWLRAHKFLLKKSGGICTTEQVNRRAYGLGPNPRVSVLLVPELRKRRSERDPVVLAQQIKDAGNQLADIKAGRVAAQ